MTARLHHLRGQLRSAASMPLWWSLSKQHMVRAAQLLDDLSAGDIQPILAELRDELAPEVIAELESTYKAIRPARRAS